MATITKRQTADGKPYYTVQVRLKGYPAQTATFDRLTDAKLWAKSTEVAIKENRHFKTAEAKKHTVAEMIDRYLSGAKLNKVQDDHTGLHLRRWKDEIGYMRTSTYLSFFGWPYLRTSSRACALGFISLG